MSCGISCFVHVFVIGAASNENSEGQLPVQEDLVSFQKNNPDKTFYYYFIDPKHRENKRDQLLFNSYIDGEVPCTFVYSPFAYKTFNREYKVLPEDETLFIDYAGVSASEYEFVREFGSHRSNWWYLSPGCNSGKLEIKKAYETSREIPKYTIFDETKVPPKLSQAYKEQLLSEINKYTLYVRLLPIEETDSDPPEWMKERDELIREGCRSTWKVLRESAENILTRFFVVNDVDIYQFPTSQWYSVARRVLEGT